MQAITNICFEILRRGMCSLILSDPCVNPAGVGQVQRQQGLMYRVGQMDSHPLSIPVLMFVRSPWGERGGGSPGFRHARDTANISHAVYGIQI